MWLRTVGGSGELAACCEAICHEALEEDRTEVGTRQVDGGGVASGTGADDDLGNVRRDDGLTMGVRTTFECSFLLFSPFFCTGAGAMVECLRVMGSEENIDTERQRLAGEARWNLKANVVGRIVAV